MTNSFTTILGMNFAVQQHQPCNLRLLAYLFQSARSIINMQLPITLSVSKEFVMTCECQLLAPSVNESVLSFVHVDQHIMSRIFYPATSVFLYVKGLSPTRNAYACLLTSIQLHPGLAFTPLTFIVFRSASLSSHLRAAA